MIHGSAVAADQFGARLWADDRQHSQVRRIDQSLGIVLGLDAQDFGRLVAVDADAPALAGVDQNLGAARWHGDQAIWGGNVIFGSGLGHGGLLVWVCVTGRRKEDAARPLDRCPGWDQDLGTG